MYMTNSTGQWVKQQVSPEINMGYALCDMAVEKGGRVHIIYYTYDFFYHIVNDTLGGTNWSKDSLAYPACCWNGGQDFKIGKNNSLHMLMQGSDVLSPYLDQDFTTYYYYRDSISTQWNPPEVITDIGMWSWLFVDSLAEPHVIWGILSLSNYYYANKKKGYWESTQILDNTYYPGYPLFVLDSGGKGYAAL
jgi:hypothetical protein